MRKNINKIDLKTEQDIAFDMLVVFDKFCRENNLRYSLIYGTLLGAVRHKGFIPWDDDIDVCMPLPDYKKLMELWDNKTSGRYQLASNYLDNFNLAYSTINDSKTYVKNSYTIKPTTSCRVKGCDEHVKLDIFCFSGLPSDVEDKRKFCKKARSYYLKALGANARLNNLFFSFITFPYYFILRCLGHKFFLKKYENLIASIDYDSAEFIGRPAEGEDRCIMLPKSDFDNLTELKFGGGVFYVIPSYDLFLKGFYGNYMKLPPKKKQVTHHVYDSFFKERVD